MRRTAPMANAVGLLAGYALDRVLGDPRRWHPVAGFGQAAGALERRLYRPDRTAGTAFTALAVGGPVLLGAVAAAATRRRPVTRAVLVAAATWTVLGGRTLRREATVMGRRCVTVTCPPPGDGSVTSAGATRRRWASRSWPVPQSSRSRRTPRTRSSLRCSGVRSPGCPGCSGYRAANTLDAMVGHRSPRYARFGTPSARLDDALNLVPSRLTGLLTVAVAPVAHGDRQRAWQVWRRDRNDHPSPNAGQCEAAMAGALGVRLGAATSTSGAPRCGRSSATVPARRRGTCGGPPGSPARSGWPPSGWPPRPGDARPARLAR